MDATDKQLNYIMALLRQLGRPVEHVTDLPPYDSVKASIEITNLKKDLELKKQRA